LIDGSGFFRFVLFEECGELHHLGRSLRTDLQQFAEDQRGFRRVASLAQALEQILVTLLAFGGESLAEIELRDNFHHAFVIGFFGERQQVFLHGFVEPALLDQLFSLLDKLGGIGHGWRGGTHVLFYRRMGSMGRMGGMGAIIPILPIIPSYGRSTTFSIPALAASAMALGPFDNGNSAASSDATSTRRRRSNSSAGAKRPQRDPTTVISFTTSGAASNFAAPWCVDFHTMVPRGRTMRNARGMPSGDPEASTTRSKDAGLIGSL